MSGHSKWATIKRQKGITDNKRGQVFTKMASAIVLAVRAGGGVTDPGANFKLRLAVDKARAANMPKENIERAIARATGAGEGGLEEAVYEGFLPGGASVIIEAATDKKQRTVAELKNMIEKNGGTLGVPGSVSYLYSRIGEIIIPLNGKSSEDIINEVLDLGVDDFDEDEGMIFLYVKPENLMTVKKGIEEKGIVLEDAGIIWKPLAPHMLEEEETKEKALSLLERIEDHDDVQKVYTNLEY